MPKAITVDAEKEAVDPDEIVGNATDKSVGELFPLTDDESVLNVHDLKKPVNVALEDFFNVEHTTDAEVLINTSKEIIINDDKISPTKKLSIVDGAGDLEMSDMVECNIAKERVTPFYTVGKNDEMLQCVKWLISPILEKDFDITKHNHIGERLIIIIFFMCVAIPV
jgi:hypothetical protein